MPTGDLSRASTSQGIDAPTRKVVGFHVEGATPSPIDSENLINKVLKSGSLSPVIIPPSFQQGQRSPEESPRQLGSTQSSRRASEDTSRPNSRIASNRNSLDDPGQAHQRGAAQTLGIISSTTVAGEGALPLTPIDPAILSTPGPDEQELVSASERAMELLRAEEDKQTQAVARPPAVGGSDGSMAGKMGATGVVGAAGVMNATEGTSSETSDRKPYEIPEKKKLTKAERRALQEAQRAAKAEQQQQQQQQQQKKGSVKENSKDTARNPPKKSTGANNAAHNAHSANNEFTPAMAATSSSLSTLAFFDHLPKREQFSVEEIAAIAGEKSIPVPCLALGIKMQEGSLRGTNNRCLAFLRMIDEVVASFELSDGQSFTREFTVAVKNMVSFLVRCRPLSPAVGNVVKSIKAELGHLATQTSLSNEDARAELRRFVATFAQDKISVAQQVLAGVAADKINDGDIILTYARSSTVERALKQAAMAGKKFSVVVADSSPLYEGKALLSELLGAGIPCEYMLFNSLETGMNLANKVLLGAAAVMSNGSVLSRAGTAACAMSASLAHVPVIVCSETYKFHERVQLDSIMNNELADPRMIASGSNCLNIVYDLTTSDFINVVITEVGALPPTSVRCWFLLLSAVCFCRVALYMSVASLTARFHSTVRTNELVIEKTNQPTTGSGRPSRIP